MVINLDQMDAISKTGLQRANRWHQPDGIGMWSMAKWNQALGGEAGELCQAALVFEEIERAYGLTKEQLLITRSPMIRTKADEAVAKIAQETCDVYLYLDLLAQRLGMRLSGLIREHQHRPFVTNWPEGVPYSVMDDTAKCSLSTGSTAVAARVGAVLNYAKKIERLDDKMVQAETEGMDQTEARAKIMFYIGWEIRNVYAHLSWMARLADFNFYQALVKTFNAVSEREDFPERL